MTPYDYHTVNQMNRADRQRERDEIRLAKRVREAARQTDDQRQPRLGLAWATFRVRMQALRSVAQRPAQAR